MNRWVLSFLLFCVLVIATLAAVTRSQSLLLSSVGLLLLRYFFIKEKILSLKFFQFLQDLGLVIIAYGVGLTFTISSSLPKEVKTLYPYRLNGIVVIVLGIIVTIIFSWRLARFNKTFKH
jgi:hypothetical protein